MNFERNIPPLDGMYVFGSDLSECVYAFDSKNDWNIVAIDAEHDDVEVVAKNFFEFILNQLHDLE